MRVEQATNVLITDLVMLVGSIVLQGIFGVRVQHVGLPTQYILLSNVAVDLLPQTFTSDPVESFAQITFAESSLLDRRRS